MKLPKLTTPPATRVLALHAFLRRLTLDDKPILVGPWRSEVGFEVLYWIPFLHWIVETFKINPSRFVIVSRGGASAWYGQPGARSVDLFTLRSLEDFRVQNLNDQMATGLQKQMAVTPWDRAVLTDAATRVLGAGAHYHRLHPSWMYWTLEPFWEEKRALRYATSSLRFPTIKAPQLPDGVTLPDKFIAVKAYHRATFGDNPMTRDFVAHLLTRVSNQLPIVLLHQPGLHADDHHDFPVKGTNILSLPAFPLERNLECLAAVLGRCHAFVGTYGGVAQLALRMGKPSVSFYSTFQGTARAHLTLSQTLASNVYGVPFVALGIGDVGLTKLCLRETQIVQAAPEPQQEVA